MNEKDLSWLAEHLAPHEVSDRGHAWPDTDREALWNSARVTSLPCELEINFHKRYAPPDCHSHSFVNLLYMYSGHARFTIERRELFLSEGWLCVLPPLVRHIVETDGDSLLVNINVNTSLLGRVARFFEPESESAPILRFLGDINYGSAYGRYMLIKTGGLAEVRPAIESLYNDSVSAHAARVKLLELSLFRLLCLLSEAPPSDVLLSPYRVSKNEPAAAALRFIDDNLSAKLTLSSAASSLNYSVPHLCRLLKSATGHTFGELVRTKRIEFACSMLHGTTLTVKDIAARSGFDCIEYFNRTFRALTGQSPSEFRESGRAE